MPAPDRPSPVVERASFWWFRTFGPRLPTRRQPEPPPSHEPFETVRIERPGRRGGLGGTLFPAGEPGSRRGRGAVLLLPPEVKWGRAYFHRRGRIRALRGAGYHVLTVDLPGRGGSGPPDGFYDRDVEDALRFLGTRAPRLPLHLWGVSAGGFWSHMALSRRDGVCGAMFEDVSPHLLEWAERFMPSARPLHLLFRTLFPRSVRYLDARRHAPHLRVHRVAYTSGERDLGVRPEETRELARRTGGEVRIIPGAAHLEGIKLAQREIVELALETFRRAEEKQRREPEGKRAGTGAPRAERPVEAAGQQADRAFG